MPAWVTVELYWSVLWGGAGYGKISFGVIVTSEKASGESRFEPQA